MSQINFYDFFSFTTTKKLFSSKFESILLQNNEKTDFPAFLEADMF